MPYETEIVSPQTGKRIISPMQLGIRPMRLYDITYPKQQEQFVMQLLNPGKTWVAKYQKYFNWIRKILGLEEIPEYKQINMPHHMFIEVIGIGHKEDKTRDGIELL